MKFTKILSGNHSDISENNQLVIRSLEDLMNLFENSNVTRTPNHIIPNINFEKQLVIALFQGVKTSGGYHVKIDHIIEKDDLLEIYFFENFPTGPATSIATNPFYLASIPKTNLPIKFIKI